jgi:23S rRNA pseudouridine2605 synthase
LAPLKIRLQKLIAEAGLASRRAAERLMREGRVWVNGEPAREPGLKVEPGRDRVLVDGQPVEPRRRITVALHKPRGYVCSRVRQTPKQRLVGDLLPAEWQDLYPVGRLDRDSEGLLLLTNDGALCLRLTHPRYGVVKTYRATVVGKLTPPAAEALCAGVHDAGEVLRARRVRVLSANASHSVVELDLTEGRRHEVRRMFRALGLEVERLVRLRLGPLRLGELPPGRWRVLTPAEVAALRQTPGPEPTAPAVDSTRPPASTGVAS